MTRLATILILSTAMCSLASANVVLIGDAVPLADLVAGQSIDVGDKTFSDFTYLTTGDMPDAVDVNVQGIIDCDGNYGFRLQGGFADFPGGGASDALITFNATVMAGANMLIEEAYLAANLDVVGGGLAMITETFLPRFNDMDLTVFNNGVTEQLSAQAEFATPVNSLPVQTDIMLLADDGGVASAFSFIDQTFSQGIVPEPTAGLLVLCGMLGLAFARRK